jgi:MYXO-CTERM domain-containing protein
VVTAVDAAVEVDVSSTPDVVTAVDAAVGDDASIAQDASPVVDAVVNDARVFVDVERKDLPAPGDIVPTDDAAVAPDGAVTLTPGSAGCGCAVPGTTSSRTPALGLLVGLALLRRRRRAP